MLDSLRRHATGWVAKVLFGILVLSFAVWGIGDIFRAPQGGGTVAEVAGVDISAQEVGREFENRVAQMQEQFGAAFDRRTAASIGVLQQAVDASVARRLVDAHARDLQLTAADETVAEIIRDNPSLQGVGGFERERFDLYLRQLGMSETEYVAAIRADLVRNGLIGAMTGPIKVPDLLTRKLVEFRLEQRRGKALVVDAATIEVEAPSDETLASYLAANAQTYEAPEYRSISLLTLAPEDLLSEIEVSDADLQAAYDARGDLYRTPEQRKFEQLLAPDEATIRRAAELAAGGQSFAQIAEAMKDDKVERSEVGPLAKGDLPEALDAAGFALAQGAVSAPVQTPFGWHLLLAQEVVAEQVQPSEAVKEELRREIALEQAASRPSRCRHPPRRRAGSRHAARRRCREVGARAAHAPGYRSDRPHGEPRALGRGPTQLRDPRARLRGSVRGDVPARADGRRKLLHLSGRCDRARPRASAGRRARRRWKRHGGPRSRPRRPRRAPRSFGRRPPVPRPCRNWHRIMPIPGWSRSGR